MSIRDKDIPIDFQKWIDKILFVNEEIILCRDNSSSDILARIREINSNFYPVFNGDDTLGRDYLHEII